MKRLKWMLLATLLFGFTPACDGADAPTPNDDEIENPEKPEEPEEPVIQADILVALDGTGDFMKIQDAIDSVPANSTERIVIFLKKGRYDTEKLIIPIGKNNISFIGEGVGETIVSYHMHNCSGGFCPKEDYDHWREQDRNLVATAATLIVGGDGFTAEGITFENTAGAVGQAQAVQIIGNRAIFRDCEFLGYQDTLYLSKGGRYSYFEHCLIVGRTDYIYGSGTGWFEGCEIRSYGGGHIVAPATLADQHYGFVFHDCRLTYASGSPNTGDYGRKFKLGRLWNDVPKVAWITCEMPSELDPAGYDKWNVPDAETNPAVHLFEYRNTGPGADMSGRVAWVGLRTLTDTEAAEFTLENVLGYNPALPAD